MKDFMKSNIVTFTKKYIYYFIIVSALLVFVLVTSVITNIHSHIEYLNCQINQNITEYNEVDLEHICNIVQCSEIIYTDTRYIKILEEEYLRERPSEDPATHLLNNIYYLDETILFYNEMADLYIIKSYTEIIKYNILNLGLVFIVFINIFSYMLYSAYKRERMEAMLHNIGNEAILANKSMVMITENVHHELNTPVEVIENKIEKVHSTLNKYIVSQLEWAAENIDKRDTIENRKWNTKIINLEKDFDFIHTSIEQILTVLEKMKNFKTLRYSNGNKTIYDVVDGAIRIILVSCLEVDYSVAKKFHNYKMAKNSLKNIDLLNVLINHMKNSIEANATHIDVICNVEGDMMHLVIKDNGHGIPNKILKDIFTPNFSSKQIGDSIRGNGMHLNKHIINEFGGDIKVLETSTEGTSIEISFNIIEPDCVI